MTCRSAVAAFLFSLYAASAYAQFDSAQISGVVQDSTGAIRPGVEVTLVSAGTSNERRTVTNEAGLYTFPNVPVGEYRLTAKQSGFKPLTNWISPMLRARSSWDSGGRARNASIFPESKRSAAWPCRS